MNNMKLPNVPEVTQDQFTEIMSVIKNLCEKHLNEEYYELTQELTAKLAKKKTFASIIWSA